MAMTNSPHLTVAISCYNKEEMIGRAINSIVDQRDVQPEIIVVDDASEDDSREMIRKELDGYDGPCRLIAFDENRGGNVARNVGVKEARTPWVQYLDGDDLLLPDTLSSLLETIKEGEADVIFAPGWGLTDGERYEDPGWDLVRADSRSEMIHRMLRRTITFHGNGTCVRSTLADEYGIEWDESLELFQEWDYCLQILHSDASIRVESSPRFIFHRDSGGSVWDIDNARRAAMMLPAYRKWRDRLEGTRWESSLDGLELTALYFAAQGLKPRQAFRIASRFRQRGTELSFEEFVGNWRSTLIRRAGVYTYVMAETLIRFVKRAVRPLA